MERGPQAQIRRPLVPGGGPSARPLPGIVGRDVAMETLDGVHFTPRIGAEGFTRRRGHAEIAGVAKLRLSHLAVLAEQTPGLTLASREAVGAQLMEGESAEYLKLAPGAGR